MAERIALLFAPSRWSGRPRQDKLVKLITAIVLSFDFSADGFSAFSFQSVLNIVAYYLMKLTRKHLFATCAAFISIRPNGME